MATPTAQPDTGGEERIVQAVEDPILSSPYVEPGQHWLYIKGVPKKADGRRPASYWYTTKRTGSRAAEQELFAEEERDDLPLVNLLREDIKRWRESGYRGASIVTRDLLQHWARDDAPRPLFFCQREAVETMIYLLELRIPGRSSRTGFRKFACPDADLERMLRGELPKFDLTDTTLYPSLVDQPADSDLLPLRRLGCKMATGAGKTVVMAMLISWAFCNRGRNPRSKEYPNAVLVCCGGITIRKRLEVLYPGNPNNYFDEFEIVPAKYRDYLNAGRVLVVNWESSFKPKSAHKEGDKTYRVVDKGEEDNEAFALDRLGDLARRLPILVLNDEGHHCWRPNIEAREAKAEQKEMEQEEREEFKDEVEKAKIWLQGLDRINNAGLVGSGQPCIHAAIDLSATPFYIAGSGHPQGRPFPWLVSDFGLVDAIESGIVKIPRLPVKEEGGAQQTDDAGRADPRYFRLWRHIIDALGPADRGANGRPKAEAVYREAEGALLTLASEWKERFDLIRDATPTQVAIPPVLIVVCDNTEIAQLFFEKVSGQYEEEVPTEDGKTEVRQVFRGSAILPELANSESVTHTVRIDSEKLKKLDASEGASKDEAAEALRTLIDTVGRRGEPGEHIRCVVSVSMLTEGWDANNVTHVLGVRAFESQLLCEQVVGRGLRRMNYTPDPATGMLPPEHVDVYGIPFSLIPFKATPKTVDPVDKPRNHVFAIPERAALEIRFPHVESYVYSLRRDGIRCDIDKLEGFRVEHEPSAVFLNPVRGYNDQPALLDEDLFERHDREEYYRHVRFSSVLFRIAQCIVDELLHGVRAEGEDRAWVRLQAKHHLFPQVLRIVMEYEKTKVQYADGVNRKDLGLERYVKLFVQRVQDNILPAAASKDSPLLPVLNSMKPYLTTADVDYTTTRPVIPVERSHLNAVMYQGEHESRVAKILDKAPCVECFTPNDRQVGLKIPYDYGSQEHVYEPDFVVRVRGGTYVLLEAKGGGGEFRNPDRVLAKNAAAKKWTSAVNNLGTFGQWTYDMCYEEELGQLVQKLEAHAAPDDALPFRFVEPAPDDRYTTCVPIVTVSAAAGAFSDEQVDPDWLTEWSQDWVTFEPERPFREGMFVAQVRGCSMEPRIPEDSYCLFTPPAAGSRNGRIVLVAYRGKADPVYGGAYTVKRYRSDKQLADDGTTEHARITLEPLNPEYEPIVLTPQDENEVRIVADFVQVVG